MRGWQRGNAAPMQKQDREPAFQPASETPIGAEVACPSGRGKPVQAGGRGPTAHADQAPGSDVYYQRARAMHAAHATRADARLQRANDQREERRLARLA
jgi:hypothetical protein